MMHEITQGFNILMEILSKIKASSKGLEQTINEQLSVIIHLMKTLWKNEGDNWQELESLCRHPLVEQFFKDWIGVNVLSATGSHQICQKVSQSFDKPIIEAIAEKPHQVIVDADAAVVGLHKSAKTSSSKKYARFELWSMRVYDEVKRKGNQVTYSHLAFSGGCPAAGDDIPFTAFQLVEERFPQSSFKVPVLVRGDGATTLDSLADMFPQGRRLLDQYHTLVKISKRLKEAFPKLSFNERKQMNDQLCELLREGKGRELIQQCHQLQTHTKLQDKQPLKRLVRHIDKHLEHLWYEEAKSLGIGVGTGIAEKDVDLLLDRRYELRGMSWTPKGANNNLKIRLCLFNNQLDALANAC